ncbi:MAG: C-terminal helicase domain-containing protein [Candidatus Omnitrophica bacterium]|nr:C-terminal helicase domain-containing protein [Candidatus Omnitrophota bacterium]
MAQQKKLDLLSNILSQPNVETALVFIRTKRRTDKVAKALHKAGFRAEAIHGDRSQSQRKRALDGFKSGRFNVLVATDVAARGIDVRDHPCGQFRYPRHQRGLCPPHRPDRSRQRRG